MAGIVPAEEIKVPRNKRLELFSTPPREWPATGVPDPSLIRCFSFWSHSGPVYGPLTTKYPGESLEGENQRVLSLSSSGPRETLRRDISRPNPSPLGDPSPRPTRDLSSPPQSRVRPQPNPCDRYRGISEILATHRRHFTSETHPPVGARVEPATRRLVSINTGPF